MTKGMTLIELLMVMAIVAILAATGTPFVSRFLLQVNMDSAVDKVTGSLRKAQTYAMSGKEGVVWGVCSYNDDIRMYGADCNSPLIKDDFDIPQSVNISGLDNVTFNRRGEPSAPITITITSNIESTSIVVNRAGGIEVN